MDSKIILEFDYMFKDKVCTNVKLYEGSKVVVTDFEDNIIFRAFGVWGKDATIIDIDRLFESRCFPESRANCKELLNDLGLEHYLPRQIINKTHGVLADDKFWIRFDYERETLNWDKVSQILK